MGQLIAWHYRTTLFAKLADHTYVTCGDLGKAWSCWGGETGGTILRQGSGSTAQANAIAGTDERAGITCYLINGVCHQAANRILFPANITVRGARGYAVSEALFGPYGRPRGLFGTCRAPFEKYSNVSGDIPECKAKSNMFSGLEKKMMMAAGDDQENDYQTYLRRVNALYGQLPADTKYMHAEETSGFQIRLFDLMTEYKLGESGTRGALNDVWINTESKRIATETLFENKDQTIGEFIHESNMLHELFQIEIANVLSEAEYQALFDLERGDTVVLGDPEIAQRQYRDMPPSEAP